MSEYICEREDTRLTVKTDGDACEFTLPSWTQKEEIVRCRDCRWLNIPDWDNTLAMLYGEPPITCDLLSRNEWRMDGDRRVAETEFLEVEPDGFCAWGERSRND